MKTACDCHSSCSSIGRSARQAGPRDRVTAKSRGIALVYAGHGHDPVLLPGLAVVGGELLLPARSGLRDVRPREPDEDGPAVELLAALEDTDAVLERAHHRRLEPVDLVARPVDAPPAGAAVVETQRHPDEAGPVVGDEVVDVAEAAGEQAGLPGRLERLPLRAPL